MRKTEMTEKQLQERDSVIKALSNAGWTGATSNALIDEGWWFDAEAVMNYENNEIELLIQYCAEDSSIDFSIQKESNGFDFVIKFEDKIKFLLDTVVDFQNSISLENHKTYMRQIMKICPLIFIVLDGKVIRLSDNDAETNPLQ